MKSRKRRSPGDAVLEAMSAVNDRDLDALRRLCRRDFMAFPASPFLGGDGRPYSGSGALANWIEDLGSRWSAFSMSMEELRERDDRVYCRVVMTVTPKRVSAPMSYELDLVLDTRRGQLTGIRSYGNDRSAALAAWAGNRG